MFPKRLFCFLLALGCLPGIALAGAAAEVESGASYCFSTMDFSREDDFTGICITDLPKAEGTISKQ